MPATKKAENTAPKTRKKRDPADLKAAQRKGGAKHTKLKEDRQRKFLKLYPELGTITAACRVVGVKRSAFVNWMTDPEFKKRFEEAKVEVGELLEAEAFKRARERSDLLLIFALKGIYPDKYKERAEVKNTVQLFQLPPEMFGQADRPLVNPDDPKLVEGEGTYRDDDL